MGIDRSKVLHSAQLFASKGQFDSAINEWKKLSVESPADGSIYNSIGELHLKRSSTGEAVAAFLQSANAFRAEGATLKAIATFKKVLKLDASRYEVYRHLGDLNAERGLLSSAVQDYLTLGKHYLKERKTKEALDIYRKIVSQDPSNLDAQQRVAELCVQENMQDEATKVYLQLGRERSAQQRFAEAKEAYQSVLRIDPANNEARQFIEHFEKSGGDPVRTSKAGAPSAVGKSLEPTDLLAEASRRIEEKQYAGAEAILNQLLSKEPGNPQVCQLLARLHLNQGQLLVALGEYRFLAGAALRAQEYTQAEALIKEFLAIEPNSVPLLELQGELYEEQGDAQTAVIHYGRAVEVLIENPEPGMESLHEEIFEKIRSLAPESAVVRKLTSLMRAGNQESTDAVPSEQPVETVSVDRISPPQEQRPEEEFSLTGAAPDDPWAPATKRSTDDPSPDLSQTDGDRGSADARPVMEFSVANAAPDDVTDRFHENPASEDDTTIHSKHEQFESYREAGRLVEAEIWLGRLVSHDPEDAESRELLGRLLEEKGDAASAAIQYARALELWTAAGDSSRTYDLYQKVKALAPGSSLLTKLPQPSDPVPAAAAQDAPSSPSADSADVFDLETHYTLGVAFKNMGLPEEAKEEFLLSMKSPAVFLDSCLMIAVCLKEQGHPVEASTHLERLLGDPRCEGTKAHAIRYELGLLYEAQAQWQRALTMYESIPTFHDVPQRLESIRTRHPSTSIPSREFRYAT